MRRTKRAALSLLLVMAATGTASAMDDPIKTRQQLMLGNAAAAGAGVAMLRGDTPFSPAVANAVFATMNAVAYSYGDYFPEGSGTGETEASPKIWEDMAGFQAALEKFRADATAAVEAKPQTMDDFKPLFAKVAENCNSCHESYRIEK